MDQVYKSRMVFGALAAKAAERVVRLLQPKDAERVGALLRRARPRAKGLPSPETAKATSKALLEIRESVTCETASWWALTSAIYSTSLCFADYRWGDDSVECRWTAHRAIHAASVAEFIEAEHRRIEDETLLFSLKLELDQLREAAKKDC